MKQMRLQAWLVILFVLTIVLAIWGWMDILNPDYQNQHQCSATGFAKTSDALSRFLDSFYIAIQAFFLSETYENSASYCFDWRLLIARWTGLFVAIGALIQAGITICFRPLARWRARRRKNHVVVIGSSEKAAIIATHFAKTKHDVTHHTGHTEAEHDDVLILPYAAGEQSELTRRSLQDAQRIIVAHSGDTQTATEAVQIALDYPDIPVFALINDPWLAKHARFAIEEKTQAGDMLIPVAWPAAVSRAVLAKHPPYLLAQDRNQDRVHLVIIGFDALGQAIVEDTLNASLVCNQKDPRFTLIDPDVEQNFGGFLSRHAGLKGPLKADGTSDETQRPIQFEQIVADFTRLDAKMEKNVLSICQQEKVTAFYICGLNANQKLERALALRDLIRRNGICEAPIFLYAPDGMGLKPHQGGAAIADGEVVVFGRVSEAIEASGMTDRYPDKAAMSYHAVYEGLGLGREASEAWQHLSEDFRRSNRRAIAHVPAKLFSLGIDLRPYLKAADLRPGALPRLDEQAMSMLETSLHIEDRLPQLEHRRWMMDKWMDGWRYGPKRDDVKKLRPDMKPYEALSSDTQAIDKAFISWLKTTLEVGKRG